MKTLHRTLFLAAMIVTFAAASKSEPVKMREWNETLRTAATVSGVVVVGAVFLPEDQDPEPRLVTAFDSAWAGRTFCVDLISADGLYQSRRLYELTGASGGTVALPYPTAHRDTLRAATGDEISVRGRLDSCDSDDGIIPVGWRSNDLTKVDTIALQINAFRADSVQIYVGDDPMAEAITCDRAEADVRTAFDTVCRFSLPDPMPERLNLEILRLSAGRASPPEFVQLVLAPFQ